MKQTKRDFGSFHSSNVEDLIRLDDLNYLKPEFKVKINVAALKDSLKFAEYGSSDIKKELFYLEEDFNFLNHGAFGLTFKPTIDLVNRWQHYAESQPLRFYDREVLPLLVDVIRRYAKFMSCKPTELVFVENCTFAFSSILRSLNIRPNENFFIFNTTYGVYKKILKNFCFENCMKLIEEQIEFPLLTELDINNQIISKLKKSLGELSNIKYVLVDYIPSNHPFVMPIKQIIDLCRSHNTVCIIDAAHAIGSISEFSLENLKPDIMFGNFHKWFCGAKGTGFLYRREGLNVNLKSTISSHGFGSGFHSDFLWSGLKDYSAYLALDGTLDVWVTLFGGLKSPIDYCVKLTCEAALYLKTKWGTEYLVNPEYCSTMICVKLPRNFIKELLSKTTITNQNNIVMTYNEAEIIQNYLYYHHRIEIPIKSIQNELYVRISCHIYNKLSDYEHLGNVIYSYIIEKNH